jgi:EAL domain-containing protein (putative c-di-GMP-specific phosphodiesterase class I)
LSRLAGRTAGTGDGERLKSLPLDKIKIDRSLVRDVGRNPRADATVAAILQLTRALGLHVVAEGVDSEEQLAVLRRERCDEVQGFFFGEPAALGLYDCLLDAPARSRA